MKRLLPLLAVLTAVVAALAWLSSKSGQESDPMQLIAAAPDAPADPGGSGATELAPGPGSEQATDMAEPAPDESPRAALEEMDLVSVGATLPLAGAVDLSAACDLDEHLEVVALAAATTYERYSRWWSPAKDSKRVLARSVVAADGSFSLDLPVDAAAAHLLLLGERLYTEKTWDADLVDGTTTPPPFLVPSIGASIQGRLRPPTNSDSDLTAVEIALRPDLSTFSTTDGAAIPMITQETKATADGSFAFRGVPTGLKYTIRALPTDLAGSQLVVDDLAPCEGRSLELSLFAGATLAGRAVDDAGQPVSGAKIQARLPGEWFGMGGERVRSESSAQDGSFILKAVMPGTIKLHGEAEGHLEASSESMILADGDQRKDLVLVFESGGAVAGRVLWDDDTPAATAEVKVSFDPAHLVGLGAFNALRGSDGEAQCLEDGTFRVTGLGKGPFVVRAEARERDPGEVEDPMEWQARLVGVKPGSEELVLKLERPRLLEGRVVDGAGEPVLVFALSASQVVEGPLGVPGQPPVRGSFESDDGHFALAGLTSGTWDLAASAEGYGAVELPGLAFPPEEGAEQLLIVLQEEAVAEGTVYGPSGEPAGGALVELDTGEPSWRRLAKGGSEQPQATSAEDGSYRLQGLTPGSVTLYARGKEYARGESVTIDISAGGVRRNVNLNVLEGGTLTGIIYRSDGEPAEGRMITVTNMGSFATSVTQSDRHGEFRVEHLDPGKLQVVAIDRGTDMADMAGGEGQELDMGGLLSSMKMTMAEIIDGEETHVILGVPPEDPVKVSGRVTHAREPYVGASVTFYSGGGQLMEHMRMCSVDKEGHYEAVLDGPGFYMVAIQKLHGGPGQQTSVEFRRDIPKRAEVHLDFAIPEGRISGRVLDPNGKPAGGVRATLTVDGPMKSGLMMGGQYSESSTDSEGRFDIPGLRPGTYSLSVGGMPMGGMFGGSAQFSRVTRGGIKVGENQWLNDIDFRLEEPGSIDVTVLDDSRRPVAGAALFVRDEAGNLLERFSMAQTDAQGKFSYGGISPGQYTICARSITEASADSPALAVRAGKSVEASLSLQTGTMLLITLQDREGNPVDASISVIDGDGRDVNGMLGFSQIMDIYGEGGLGLSTHRVGPLAPGTYRVLAEDDEGHKANKPVRLAGQVERKVKLRLK